jgi:hypothetical protein
MVRTRFFHEQFFKKYDQQGYCDPASHPFRILSSADIFKADLMDTRPADYLRHRLLRFAAAIEETREHAGELSPFGRYAACAPYYERSGIQAFFDSLAEDLSPFEDLLKEFRQLDARLQALEQDLGEAYRRQLWDELSAYTDRYYSAVCMENARMLKFGTDHEVFCRDRIAVLLHELEKDHDTREIKTLIHLLDRNLFCPGEQGDGKNQAVLQETDRIPHRPEGDTIES